MRFRPEKIFIGKNADGSTFRIEQWDYDTRAGIELLGSFMNIFAAVLFVQIISPFLLVLAILGFNGRANILNIIGVVFGSYFLYDAYNGWIVTSFLNILLSEGIFNILVKLNAIAVVLHLILLVFSNLIFNIINKTYDTEDKCKRAFLSIILIVGFVVFIFTDYVLITHPGWVDKNIQGCLERNTEPEPEPVEEVTPAYDDGFFHHDPNYDKEQDEFYHGKSKE